MSRARIHERLRPGVYTTALVVLVVLLAPLVAPGPARADVDLTIDPAMTRGAASAPVTIVEFSDYQ